MLAMAGAVRVRVERRVRDRGGRSGWIRAAPAKMAEATGGIKQQADSVPLPLAKGMVLRLF